MSNHGDTLYQKNKIILPGYAGYLGKNIFTASHTRTTRFRRFFEALFALPVQGYAMKKKKRGGH
jgi:hypothetical protein